MFINRYGNTKESTFSTTRLFQYPEKWMIKVKQLHLELKRYLRNVWFSVYELTAFIIAFIYLFLFLTALRDA